MHLFREELTPDEFREAKIEAICNLQTAAFLVCKKAGLPVRYVAGRYILDFDQCWCPDPYRIATDDLDNPDARRMRILDKVVLCPPHGTRFSARAVMEKALQGKRKSQKNKDEDLAKFNINPQPERFYVFQSGVDFETTGLDTDLRDAVASVRLSPKQPCRGVLLEVADAQRARAIIKDMSADLPWRDLHEVLRDDLTLTANWHGAPLTMQEKLALHTQRLETAKTKRAARQKLVEQMRRQADALVIEPL